MVQKPIIEDSDLWNERKQIRKENKEYLKRYKSSQKEFEILKMLPSCKCAENEN